MDGYTWYKKSKSGVRKGERRVERVREERDGYGSRNRRLSFVEREVAVMDERR